MILRKPFVRSQWKRGSNSLSVCCLAHILLLHQALRELAKNITLNTQIPRLFHAKEETCSPIKYMLWAKCTLCVAAMTIHLFIPREGRYCVIFSYVVRKEHWYSQFFINCACLDSWFSVVLGIAREQLPQQYFSQLTVCGHVKKIEYPPWYVIAESVSWASCIQAILSCVEWFQREECSCFLNCPLLLCSVSFLPDCLCSDHLLRPRDYASKNLFGNRIHRFLSSQVFECEMPSGERLLSFAQVHSTDYKNDKRGSTAE